MAVGTGSTDSSNKERCITRVPYATLIATLLSCAGVAIFLGSLYRGLSYTKTLFNFLFHSYTEWLGEVHVAMIGLGVVMGAANLCLLVSGWLATGPTRLQLYGGGWRARLSGRVACGVLSGLAYLLSLLWTCLLVLATALLMAFLLMSGLCDGLKLNPRVEERCLDLTHFQHLFPNTTQNLRFCKEGELKIICKDCVEPAIMMYILTLAACVLVLLSLIHHLMCLAANTARIRDSEKFQELQELQYLQDNSSELAVFKDRYRDTSEGIFRQDSLRKPRRI
ncbi:GPM6B [Cordylochernes scorpioides]|uniref:GPM6B n=1 Tax=Cordylochernes scorpioides TaxID=51811 RepID=A0ABY6K992_9ARAC|nr:GPM6B [Cordylochernes scorpioides]